MISICFGKPDTVHQRNRTLTSCLASSRSTGSLLFRNTNRIASAIFHPFSVVAFRRSAVTAGTGQPQASAATPAPRDLPVPRLLWLAFLRTARRHLSVSATLLTGGSVTRLTSQFPSTTAAHVTALYTGVPAGQHGVFEWQYWPPGWIR